MKPSSEQPTHYRPEHRQFCTHRTFRPVVMVLAVFLFVMAASSCGFFEKKIVVWLTEASWMELIDEWAETESVRVDYFYLEGNWPSHRPEPDLLIGPGIHPWKERYQDLRPILDEIDNLSSSNFVLRFSMDGTLSMLALTLVPAVVIYPRTRSVPPAMEWKDLLELPPRNRAGLKFSPWWVPDLVPSLLAEDPRQLEAWRLRDQDLPNRLSGIVPFIELNNGRIPAWVLPLHRLRQLERQDLSVFSWSFLLSDKKQVLYPQGAFIALTKAANSEAKKFFRWLMQRSSLRRYLQAAPSMKMQSQWSNFAKDATEDTTLGREFLAPIFVPDQGLQRLRSGEMDAESFLQKCVLTY